MALSLNEFNQIDFTTRFKLLAEEVVAILATAGLKTKPYHSAELPLFSAMGSEAQARAVAAIEAYKHALAACVAGGDDLRANSRALWHTLRVLKLHGSDTLFSNLESEDAIELYSSDGIQLWRNCRVMEVCSYSLEEIYSLSWLERYERDPQIAAEVMSHVELTLSGGRGKVVEVPVPAHIIRESCSEEKIALRVRHKTLHAISDQAGHTTAFLAVSSAEVVDSAQIKPRPNLSLAPNAI